VYATTPTTNPALEVILGAVWLIIAVKSGVIVPVLVVAEISVLKAPKVVAGTGIEVSIARSSIVAVLDIEVVDTTAMLVAVGTAVDEDGGRVKDKRAAQVAGSSPYVVVG
jgi:hypothetical protein